MKIVWSDSAKTQLKWIKDYISQQSPDYGKLTAKKIVHRVSTITDFPMAGRVVPEYGHEQIREVHSNPYRILYHISGDRIEILAVVHSRQLIEEENE